jgi:hypothetical protein
MAEAALQLPLFLHPRFSTFSDEGKPCRLKLLYSLKELKEKLLGESAILKSADSLMDKMRKEAQKWLNSLSANHTPLDASIYKADGSNIISKPSHIHTNSRGERFAHVEKGTSKPSLIEKASENLQIAVLQISQRDSSLEAGNGQKPSIREVYSFLRAQLNKPFNEGEAIALIAKFRQCSFEEAQKLFQNFVDEGKLFKDTYGLWHWASGFSMDKPNGEVAHKTGELLLQCPFCRAEGKRLFFASRHDLNIHVKAKHPMIGEELE